MKTFKFLVIARNEMTRQSNLLKSVSRLFAIFGLLMMFAVSGWGDTENNDNCSQIEQISEMHNQSGTYSRTETGQVQNSDPDYYYFTIPQNGTLSYSYTSTERTDLRIQVGGSCSTSMNRVLNNGTSLTATTASITAGDTVMIHIARRNGTPNYSLDLSFSPPSANLALTNTDSPDPVVTNQSLVYTLNVTNNGPNTATGLTLTDTLPAGVMYQSATGTGWSCSQAAGVVTCTNPTLANGASSNVSITITAPATAGTITNTATVTSALPDLTPANNTNIMQVTTVNPPNADLVMTKTAPATAKTSNTIQYTLSVSNNGPSSTNNITVTDTLPASVTYQTSYGTDWICTYTSATRIVSCVHPTDLLNGSSANDITIVTVAPSSAQTVTNTASVTSTLPDYASANNTSSASTTVSTTSFTSSNERAFTLQKQYNINGNMKTIGNSMLLRSNGICAGTGTNNNDISTIWANRDTDGTTWNATSADLVLPPGVDSTKIKYAALYWQGRVDSDNDNAAFWAAAKTIKFKAQGLAYQTLTSVDSKYNWTLRSSDANYQGGLEVTDIIKNSINTVSTSVIDSTGFTGTFWGANVQAEQMSNGFGAWSLVVIYEDYDDTLKNISLYDGYISVDDGETIPTTLSGFLTPTSGPVESDFMIFAGEGDVTLTDSVTMSNSSGDQSLGNNVFNSSQTIDGVSVTARDPACPNTIGIDIDSFNVGTTSTTTPIIRNNQTSTIVKLKSTGDVYYPGAFAFSTQLYVPDVCYLEDVTFNSLPITASNLPLSNDNVEYEVSITNKNNEAAKGVFIEKIFDKPGEITYVPGSMKIAPIPGTSYTNKTDTIGDDTAEFATDTNTSKLLLGTGATWYEGGTIVKDALTKFKYQAKIGDQNASENTYLVSYRNDLLHITFSGLPIRKCVDFNNSFGILLPTPGKFNAVMPGRVTDGSDDGSPYSENRLLTQVTNKNFSLDILSLGTDLATVDSSYKGRVQVEFVTPPYDTCQNAPLLANSPTLYAGFVNPSGNGRANAVTSAGSTSFSIPTAATNTAVRVKYVVNNSGNTANWTCVDNTYNCIWGMLVSTFGNNASTPCKAVCEPGAGTGNNQSSDACVACVFGPSYTQSSCSKDVFSVRPSEITMDANETRLIGAKWYQFDMKATQYGLTTPSTGYIQVIDNTTDKNGTTALVTPAGCTLPTTQTLFTDNVPFSDGVSMVAMRYMNVGDVNMTVMDQNWATVDRNTTSPSDSDCVEGSSSNIVDGNGKVGCLVQGSKTFTFLPDKFDSLMSLANGSVNGSFTYVSSDQNMSAPLILTTTAKLDGGGTATNYTAKCFARDINTSVSLMNNKLLTWSDAQNRINFYDDRNVTSFLRSQTGSSAILGSSEGNFTSGTAQLTFLFNFDRNQTIPDDSFMIARNDFNITSIVDQNGTTGNDFIRTGDINATFVYGRIVPRDVRIFGNVAFNANGWYEIYNVQNLGGVPLVPSRNDSMWYINNEHIDTGDGDANITRIQQGSSSTASNISSSSILTGIETYGFAAQTPPYGAKAHIGTESWLWYGATALPYADPSALNLDCFTHPCFNINVVPAVGATGSAKTGAETKKASKKSTSEAGAGGWKSTSDYAPAIR
jgi:trimeric autotransporter adhesin